MKSDGRVTSATNVERRPRRGALRALVFVLTIGSAMLSALPALAFHESFLNASLRADANCSDADQAHVEANGVKSFNETVTQSIEPVDTRSFQSSSVSGSSIVTVTTSSESSVTTSDAGGCGLATSSLSVLLFEDDSEFTGDYEFRIVGSLSFADGSVASDGEDGCLGFDVGGVVGETKCVGDDETISVDHSGFANSPDLSVFTSIAVANVSGSATARWEFTLTVFPPDICPAAAGGAETASVARAASAEDPGVEAAAECPAPTVGFANDPGFDGLLTEADSAVFQVLLSAPQPTDVVVNVQTRRVFAHEAIRDEDFQQSEGEVTIHAGEVFTLFTVPLIEDANAEPDEEFGAVLTLSGANAAPVTLGRDSAFAIIRDDDCALHVPNASAANDITVPDGTTGAVCGSVFNDTIQGSSQGDIILGGAGDDVLTGRGGQDSIVGGTGNDQLFGGFGLDLGDDPSRDFLTGGPTESQGPDNDEIFGEGGNDIIDGGAGNDQLFGGEGGDDVAGGADVDTVRGGPGRDILFAADRPTPIVAANTAAYITENTNGDILQGDAGNDTLHGSSGDNLLFGGDDNDTIYGHAGQDRLFGESGADTLLEGPLFSLDLVKDFLIGGNSAGHFDSCIATPVIDDKVGCEL